jgi:hypothetical protein
MDNYKYYIIGMHCSGKKAIADELNMLGVPCGRVFTNLPEIPPTKNIPNELYYSGDDIRVMFETNSYIFLHENFDSDTPYYEGISTFEYEKNKVLFITPQQFNYIPKFNDNDVFVWLDNSEMTRRMRYRTEHRKYDFSEEEKRCQCNMDDFIERVNQNPHFLYFNNEEPMRVASIVYTLIQHPELLPLYEKNFN